MVVYLLKMEKYCMLIPISVLEGFSLSVAIAIGFSQWNNAFGIYGLKHHKSFFANQSETFSNLDQLSWTAFVPFLAMFACLMTLLKKFPKHPWIILIALVGNIYGLIVVNYIPGIAPKCLVNLFPRMLEPSIASFEHFQRVDTEGNTIPWSVIFTGAGEVAFVAVLETLISARIADNATGTRIIQDKEIFGMALGNMLSGLFGGTPVTGVLVRTSVCYY